jgi:mono/diheme cytochrome c family protein
MPASKSLIISIFVSFALLTSATAISDESDESMESRGKYIVEIGGCNDCHTAGFGLSGGATPESEWLLGDILGFRGPWGTTYAPNLRTYMRNLTEEAWVTVAKSVSTRPPMPWWALNVMKPDDLRAIYRYIRSLELVETEIPAYVPPDQEPAPPFIQWPSPPE